MPEDPGLGGDWARGLSWLPQVAEIWRSAWAGASFLSLLGALWQCKGLEATVAGKPFPIPMARVKEKPL